MMRPQPPLPLIINPISGHGADGRQLAADLVVDASGRTSATPAWLAAAALLAGIVLAWMLFNRDEKNAGSPQMAIVVENKAPGGNRAVLTLANGRKGRYLPMSCGASCSPPSVVWKERGVVYEISADATRAQLVRMANSAIKRGPR